jgi:hypothetical protein
MKERWSAIGLVGFLMLAALSAGCPGELENPDDFASMVPCDPQGLMQHYCQGSGCHEPSADADPGQLDLISPGVEARLVDQNASYYNVADTEIVQCPTAMPEKLIDTANPDKSLFILKLEDHQTCGVKMPFTGRSPRPSQIQCLKDWALGLAGATPSADAGADGGAP